MIKHIHILGASGSGTTTLAERIESELDYRQLDTDKYFWIPTNPPFTDIRPVEERIQYLNKDIRANDQWVLSGSICGWGDYLIDSFDLVIYLQIPKDIRLKRLESRERQKYGDRINQGNDQYETYIKFIEWAAKYDEGGLDIRSKVLHNKWMDKLKCQVLRIEEDISIEEKMDRVRKIIDLYTTSSI